jgi:tRNA 2-thiouridine synthesizing protein A
MERTLDARGLNCPLPLIKARAALAGSRAGDVLVVLATDPEAPIDLAALAADLGLDVTTDREGDVWRIALGGRPAPPHAHGGAGSRSPT